MMPNFSEVLEGVDTSLDTLQKRSVVLTSGGQVPWVQRETMHEQIADLKHEVRLHQAKVAELQTTVDEFQSCLENHGVKALADLDRQLKIANEFCGRTIDISRERDATKGLSLAQRLFGKR